LREFASGKGNRSVERLNGRKKEREREREEEEEEEKEESAAYASDAKQRSTFRSSRSFVAAALRKIKMHHGTRWLEERSSIRLAEAIRPGDSRAKQA